MSNTNQPKNPSKYGVLGLDVGNIGRWTRLLVGLVYLIPLIFSILIDPETLNILTQTIIISQNVIGFYILLITYFIGIVLLYLLVYKIFGEKVFAKNNGWLNSIL